ncbi:MULTISPECIES: gliding motility protein GldM [Sphingobacterium]|uniref:type IX secretion system motor protein PorM/GldM n=1 Tax=Sphingobacterium TaxID=28453 RepID=UPI00104ED9BB|nr:MULTISPECIES: gliding motility protein GldM [Sphingobacterium]MCW2262121.1 gliding motility-associated protein GldM [Sphingobacterium kitahiroshimense]NJI74951.1 gliding motility protein GldM [Sphingobacterium sp. B16(2022)]TCR13132.1 gliding motility-associated protein GldM [Sphingobacterium sp. JUb78]
MALGRETPRQRMISILYLVLLALLALNVPDTILDAFKNINNSLESSRSNVNTAVQQLFSAFESTKLKEEPARAKPIYDKAKKAQAIIGELNTYISSLKEDFTKQGGGIDPEKGDLVKRENEDISPNLMINEKKGTVLKDKINETRAKLLALLTPEEQKSVSFSLEAKDPEKSVNGKKSWEEINFGSGTPLTAAMTILTKIQTDAQNAESDMVKLILGKMDQAVVNLDKFAAVAVAPTSYLVQGQPYKAEVFLTASDSKSQPAISVNGSPLQIVDGKGVYNVSTSKEGIFSWTGVVQVKQTDGSMKEYRTATQTYQVARPSAVVSPDKMNVLYIGVDNPLSVSAAGTPTDKVKVSMTGGSLSGSGGKYNARVSSPGTARISISAEVAPGKMQTLSTTEFRVKRIPDPIAKFAGKTGGSMATVALKAQNAIFAKLDNFDFDANFKVTKFTMIIAKPRADAIVLSTSGNQLSSSMASALNGITPGTRVIFDNIVAVGPDGTSRQLNAVALTAN